MYGIGNMGRGGCNVVDASIKCNDVVCHEARVAGLSLELSGRAFSDLILPQSRESKPSRAFFNRGCNRLLDAAVEGLFNVSCNPVLDACGKA